MIRALCVGECMIELRHADAATLRLGYAGDTYNAAVYLRRVAAELGAGVRVGYLTGVGDDLHSEDMRAAWRADGIEDRACVVPGKAPGLYIVRTDDAGERSFAYWRADSAAGAMFSGSDWLEDLDGDLLHLSGISLQLMTDVARTALLQRLDELRAAGARIAFDTNYRPQGWPSAAAARAAIDAVATRAHVVFSTLEDEAALHGRTTGPRSAERLLGLGAEEVVVKAGAGGAWIGAGGRVTHRAVLRPARVVDTTAAGDALAGAYLAARLAGESPPDALELAMRVAATVIAHPGALTPRALALLPGR